MIIDFNWPLVRGRFSCPLVDTPASIDAVINNGEEQDLFIHWLTYCVVCGLCWFGPSSDITGVATGGLPPSSTVPTLPRPWWVLRFAEIRKVLWVGWGCMGWADSGVGECGQHTPKRICVIWIMFNVLYCWENALVSCRLCLYIWLGFWGIHPRPSPGLCPYNLMGDKVSRPSLPTLPPNSVYATEPHWCYALAFVFCIKPFTYLLTYLLT